MRRIVFSISVLSCVLIFAPLARPQQINENNDLLIENLCDPDAPQEFVQEGMLSGLNFDQIENVRIQLLERGFDPGFDPDRDNTIDAQLTEALAQFQAEYELPVTGFPDIPTLTALSIPTQEIELQNF